MTTIVQPSSTFSSSPYYGGFSSYRSAVPLVTVTTVTHSGLPGKKGLFRRKGAVGTASPTHTTVTPGPGAITMTTPVVQPIAGPVSTTTSTAPIVVQGPISTGLPAVSGISQTQVSPALVQQPLALQQPRQQPLVQSAMQPIQAVGATAFQATQPAGITTQNIIGQPTYQAQAAPLQGFSQQQVSGVTGIPTAREAGNWNQLGEYGWYNRSGGQQYASTGMAGGMQQVTGQQLYQAEPTLQQQGFNRAVSQQFPQGQQAGQASFVAATPQSASFTGQTATFAAQPSGQAGSFAQPMASSNLGQASSFAEPSAMQSQGQASFINQPMAASSFEQQASGFNQQMGQATSELGRASQSVGNIERSMQAGSQFLQSSTAPIGTGAR